MPAVILPEQQRADGRDSAIPVSLKKILAQDPNAHRSCLWTLWQMAGYFEFERHVTPTAEELPKSVFDKIANSCSESPDEQGFDGPQPVVVVGVVWRRRRYDIRVHPDIARVAPPFQHKVVEIGLYGEKRAVEYPDEDDTPDEMPDGAVQSSMDGHAFEDGDEDEKEDVFHSYEDYVESFAADPTHKASVASVVASCAMRFIAVELAPLTASVWHAPTAAGPPSVADYFYPRRVLLEARLKTPTTADESEPKNGKRQSTQKWPQLEYRLVSKEEWLDPGTEGRPGPWHPYVWPTGDDDECESDDKGGKGADSENSQNDKKANPKESAEPPERDIAQEVFGWTFYRIVDTDVEVPLDEVNTDHDNPVMPRSLLEGVPRFDASELLLDNRECRNDAPDGMWPSDYSPMTDEDLVEIKSRAIEKLGEKRGRRLLAAINHEVLENDGGPPAPGPYNEDREDIGPCRGCLRCMGDRLRRVVVASTGERLYHRDVDVAAIVRGLRVLRSPLSDKIRCTKLAGVVVAKIPKFRHDGTEVAGEMEEVITSVLWRSPPLPEHHWPPKYRTQRRKLDEAQVPGYKRREWMVQLREMTALMHDLGITLWDCPHGMKTVTLGANRTVVLSPEGVRNGDEVDTAGDDESGDLKDDEVQGDEVPDDDWPVYELEYGPVPGEGNFFTEQMAAGVDTEGNVFISDENGPLLCNGSFAKDWVALCAKAVSWGVGTDEDVRTLDMVGWSGKPVEQVKCEYETEEMWDGRWEPKWEKIPDYYPRYMREGPPGMEMGDDAAPNKEEDEVEA